MGRGIMRFVPAAVAVAVMLGGAGGLAAQGSVRTEAEAGGVERYEVDVAHSHVGFMVRHLAVANVRGRFTRFGGHILVDAQDVTNSTVSITIEAGSIDTDNQRRDDHLRSDDFFDAAAFPALTFVGRRVDRTAAGLELVGDLTIRDVTREVRIPFELTGPVTGAGGQSLLGAEGTLRINRFDFGLQWNRFTEAVQVVGDEVRIELQIEARTRREE